MNTNQDQHGYGLQLRYGLEIAFPPKNSLASRQQDRRRERALFTPFGRIAFDKKSSIKTVSEVSSIKQTLQPRTSTKPLNLDVALKYDKKVEKNDRLTKIAKLIDQYRILCN